MPGAILGIAVDKANFGVDKVVPVCSVLNVSNSYSTGIPWSKEK